MLYRRLWSRPSPRKRNAKKAKWLSEEALQIAEKRREAKGKGEKERYTHLNAEFQTIARRDKEAFLTDQCKEIEENNRMGKTRDLFKKIRDTKGTFHAKMGSIKDRKCMDLTEAEDIKKRWQQKKYTKEIFMTQITTMVWWLTEIKTSWKVKSSGPQEASLWTKLVEAMNSIWAISYGHTTLNAPDLIHLSYFKP